MDFKGLIQKRGGGDGRREGEKGREGSGGKGREGDGVVGSKGE